MDLDLPKYLPKNLSSYVNAPLFGKSDNEIKNKIKIPWTNSTADLTNSSLFCFDEAICEYFLTPSVQPPIAIITFKSGFCSFSDKAWKFQGLIGLIAHIKTIFKTNYKLFTVRKKCVSDREKTFANSMLKAESLQKSLDH